MLYSSSGSHRTKRLAAVLLLALASRAPSFLLALTPLRQPATRSRVTTTTTFQNNDPTQRLRSSQTHPQYHRLTTHTATTTQLQSATQQPEPGTSGLVGDDAAYFSFQDQKLEEWAKFSAATGTVLALVAYVWFLPMGPHWGDVLLNSIQSTLGTTDPAATVFTMLLVFAVFHSGLAGLRPYAEDVVGPRAWRVVFALVSLPLALSCISYFVNHAHEGTQLWDLTHVPGLHGLLWVTNFVSFMFLYPSTFNLLEIAAIQEPQLHLWETGIIRITRHPQAVGQYMWCLAHTLWLGTSTAVAASTVLVAHHAFSMYHGDRRLRQRHGAAFDYVKSRTSVVPFAAILDGRQELPPDYYKEFLRGPYLLVVGGTIAAYFAHPYMQAGAALLKW